MSFDTGEQVADGRDGQEDRRRHQTSRAKDDRQELEQAHNTVGTCAHVVGRDAPDRGVEPGRGRANAEEKRNLDEDNDEAGYPLGVIYQSDNFIMLFFLSFFLSFLPAWALLECGDDLQGENGKDDNSDTQCKDTAYDIGYAKCEAQNHGKNADPRYCRPAC